MWTKEEAESWIFQQLEYIELLILEYFNTLIGFIKKPIPTTIRLINDEKISPFIFFIINVVIAAAIENGELFRTLLKSVVLTAKPTWDDNLWSILSLIVGSLLFVLLFRATAYYATRIKLPYSNITRSILYASFTFAPIALIKLILAGILINNILPIADAFIAQSILTTFVTVTVAFVFIFWWAFIVFTWLKLSISESIIPYRKILFKTIFAYFVVTLIAINIKHIADLQSLAQANGYKRVVDGSLSKSPPDYFAAATASMFTSNIKQLTPYRRYCEKLRTVVYLSKFVSGFDFDYGIKTLTKSDFEEVEKYYSGIFSKVDSIKLSEDENRKLSTIKFLLQDAKKEKDDRNFIKGEYVSTFRFVELPIHSDNKYIRLIP